MFVASSYQIPEIQTTNLLQQQLNTLLRDIKARLVDPAVSGTVNTTTATPATIATIPIATGASVVGQFVVKGQRTGGSSGAAGDSGGYVVRFVAKNVAGTVTIIGQNTATIGESQAGWDAAAAVSTTNVVIQGTGAANNNITWTASGTIL